nr:retrotransposon protein, putative, Ty1-copia subclass [Tanacetum cinerariifolium]
SSGCGGEGNRNREEGGVESGGKNGLNSNSNLNVEKKGLLLAIVLDLSVAKCFEFWVQNAVLVVFVRTSDPRIHHMVDPYVVLVDLWLTSPGYPKKIMGYYFYFPPENKIVVVSQWEIERVVELKEIQDEDTSPSKNTSEYLVEAEGFKPPQEIDYEETFSPVADIRDIRIRIAITEFYDYNIWKMCHTPPRRKREARRERESSQHIGIYIEKIKHA